MFLKKEGVIGRTTGVLGITRGHSVIFLGAIGGALLRISKIIFSQVNVKKHVRKTFKIFQNLKSQKIFLKANFPTKLCIKKFQIQFQKKFQKISKNLFERNFLKFF